MNVVRTPDFSKNAHSRKIVYHVRKRETNNLFLMFILFIFFTVLQYFLENKC